MRADDELMTAYRLGEIPAFDELVARHRGRVFGFLRRLVRDEALAEDALIETFFRLHAAAGSYEPRGKFSSFLFRIAYREAGNIRRDGHRRASIGALAYQEDGAGSAVDPGEDPEGRLQREQDRRRLEQALTALPETWRAVFLLYYREAMPTADIASTLEIPPGSVRAYLTMARKAMRETLEREEAPARPGALRTGRG